MDGTTHDLLISAEELIQQAKRTIHRPTHPIIPDYYAPVGTVLSIIRALREFLDALPSLTGFDPDEYDDSNGLDPRESIRQAQAHLDRARTHLITVQEQLDHGWTHLGRLELREAEGEHALGVSDTEKIDHHIRSLPIPAQGGYPLISDAAARMIASTYHSGQNSLGYSFVATGAIPVDPAELWRDLFHDTWDDMSEHYRTIADHLGVYLHTHGPRGPVPHWPTLWL